MYEPPIYETALCSPVSGMSCRVWLADGTETLALMFRGKWLMDRGDPPPVRWQRLAARWSTSAWQYELQVPGPIPPSPGWKL